MADKLQINPQASRAILIGASEFERDHRLSSLKAVMANLRDLENRLVNPAVVGIEDVIRLDNRPYPDLIDRVRSACATPMDCLILYYVGHGLVGYDGTLLLATANTTFEGKDDNAVPYRSLRRLILNAKARVTLVILDCCFGGRALTKEAVPQARPLTRDELEKFAQGEGRIQGSFLIASSSQDEESFTRPGARNSGFTGHLLEILDKGLPIASEVLTIEEVFDAVTDRCEKDGLPRPVKVFAEDAYRVGIFKNANNSDIWRARLQQLIELDPKRATPLHEAIEVMDRDERDLKKTGAGFDEVLAQLLETEGKRALENPLVRDILANKNYQKYLQSNPFGLRITAEEAIITVEPNGDTTCKWTKRGTPTASPLWWVAFAAFGDTPLDGFDAIQLSVLPFETADKSERKTCLVPLNDTPTRKSFLALFLPAIPIGVEFSQTVQWQWRELFAPLVKQGIDTWGHVPSPSVAPLLIDTITFFLHQAIGKVDIRNAGSGDGSVERLEQQGDYCVIRWSAENLNSSSRLLLELSTGSIAPAIR